MNLEYYQRYLDYITNTGGSPKIEWFDDDWEPIGPMIRRDLKEAKLIREYDGKIFRIDAEGRWVK